MEQPGKSVFDGASRASDGSRGRDSLFLSARLRVVGHPDEIEIRVRNLSAGGLMAELPAPLSSTELPIEVQVRGIGWVAGRIAWQTEGRAGISFDREIDPQRARKPVTDRAAAATPRRFGPLGPRG